MLAGEDRGPAHRAAMFLAGAHLTAGGSEFRFDRTAGRLYWVRQDPFRVARGEVKLSRVVDVFEQLHRDEGVTYRLAIRTDREAIPMSAGCSSFRYPEEKQAIRDWLQAVPESGASTASPPTPRTPPSRTGVR